MSRTRLLLLCPGQGDQHAGMFDMARTNAAANTLLDRLHAGGLLPAPDAHGDIFANRIAQPLIVAATLSMWEAIRECTPTPALVAGYSIGELSAYGVAGAIDAPTACALASQRAHLMDACQQAHPGQTLLTITGLPLASASTLAAAHGYHISIETGEDSCIAGGPAAHADALQQAIENAGARSRRLPVQIASHTPFMQDAVEPYAAALRATPFATIGTPVLAGISATAVRTHQAAADTLSRQLSHTIHWLACMDAANEAGITVALELGPGNALSHMLQNRHPHIQTRSVADFRTLDGIRKWLKRACDDE